MAGKSRRNKHNTSMLIWVMRVRISPLIWKVYITHYRSKYSYITYVLISMPWIWITYWNRCYVSVNYNAWNIFWIYMQLLIWNTILVHVYEGKIVFQLWSPSNNFIKMLNYVLGMVSFVCKTRCITSRRYHKIGVFSIQFNRLWGWFPIKRQEL